MITLQQNGQLALLVSLRGEIGLNARFKVSL